MKSLVKNGLLAVAILMAPASASSTEYCSVEIGSGKCSNKITMAGDGVSVTSVYFATRPANISQNFNITGIPVCYTVSVSDSRMDINWNTPSDYNQYAGNINSVLFYNNTPSSGECRFDFVQANGKAQCEAPKPPVVLAIDTDLKEGYAYKGSNVTLTAKGFDEGSRYRWFSATKAEGPWTELSGSSATIVVTPMVAGNNFYKVSATSEGATAEVSIDILAKISCASDGSAGQRVIWEERFYSLSEFADPLYTRKECRFVTGYEFSTWDNTCGASEGKTGKVCDGQYVVVANSTAANPSACGWPEGQADHTRLVDAAKQGGFLIINAGEPEKVMYEQAFTPASGFCEGVFYNFSLFATNITAAGNDPARFAFDIVEILDNGSEIYLVKRYDSGPIQGSLMEKWYEYGVTFEAVNVSRLKNIVVRIWNTGASDFGNDVVIDDITISVCSPTAEAFIGNPSDNVKTDFTEECGRNLTINAVVKGDIQDYFSSTPYYLWQKRVDGSNNWEEIGESHSSGCPYVSTSAKTYIRAIVASDETMARNVASGSTALGCGVYAITDEVIVKCSEPVVPEVIIPTPAVGTVITCSTEQITLTAECNIPGVEYVWSDQQTGSSITVTEAGTYTVYVTIDGAVISASIDIHDERGYVEAGLVMQYPDGDEYSVGDGPIDFDIIIKDGEFTGVKWYRDGEEFTPDEPLRAVVTPYTDCVIAADVTAKCNTVKLEKSVSVKWPTIITPHNNDGFNDSFATGMGISLMLFDRHGNMQYKGNDGLPQEVADRLMPDVYFYRAVLPDGTLRKNILEIYK